jgi:lambda repressor-like predicted transcriptional regulator
MQKHFQNMRFSNKSSNFARMIREAIIQELSRRGISKRKCAIDNGLVYQNFNNFLLGKRPFPLDEIEKVFNYLGLEIIKKEE